MLHHTSKYRNSWYTEMLQRRNRPIILILQTPFCTGLFLLFSDLSTWVALKHWNILFVVPIMYDSLSPLHYAGIFRLMCPIFQEGGIVLNTVTTRCPQEDKPSETRSILKFKSEDSRKQRTLTVQWVKSYSLKILSAIQTHILVETQWWFTVQFWHLEDIKENGVRSTFV